MRKPITEIARAARGWTFVAGLALAVPASALAAPRHYGYSYGPELSYEYIAGPVYAGGFGEPFHRCRFACRFAGHPILSLTGYWRPEMKKTAIAVIRGGHVVIR